MSAPLCVPETLHTSCDLLVLVEQSSEPVAPSDGVRLARRQVGEWSEGSGLVECPVWWTSRTRAPPSPSRLRSSTSTFGRRHPGRSRSNRAWQFPRPVSDRPIRPRGRCACPKPCAQPLTSRFSLAVVQHDQPAALMAPPPRSSAVRIHPVGFQNPAMVPDQRFRLPSRTR